MKQKNQIKFLDIKIAMSGMKNTQNETNSILNIVEENISECEDITKETTHKKTQKRFKENERSGNTVMLTRWLTRGVWTASLCKKTKQTNNKHKEKTKQKPRTKKTGMFEAQCQSADGDVAEMS